MPTQSVPLVRIFLKCAVVAVFLLLSFFKGFKTCHKILLGQGTRQATRWLRMIYFPDFRLLKRECREKASTYLEADRIWKIKGP